MQIDRRNTEQHNNLTTRKSDKSGFRFIYRVNQFRTGMNAELADGTYHPLTHFASDNPILVGKVVRAHLNKTPDYYTQWAADEKATERAYRHRPAGQPRLAKTG